MHAFNPLFYITVAPTHWVLPIAAAALFWWFYKRMLASMEVRLERAEKTIKADLFSSIPNYTRFSFRINLALMILGSIIFLGILSNSLSKNEGLKKIFADGKHRASFEKLPRAKMDRYATAELNVDYSGSAWVMALMRIKQWYTPEATAKDGRLVFLVPESVTEDELRARLQTEEWVVDKSSVSSADLMTHIEQVAATSGEQYVTFLILIMMLGFPAMVAVLLGFSVLYAAGGYAVERVLLTKIGKAQSAGLTPAAATITAPLFGEFAFKLLGNAFTLWPAKILCGGKKRLAIVPASVLQNRTPGQFLDLWPKLRVLPAPVMVVLFFVSGVFIVTSIVMSVYMAIAFTKNVWLAPAEPVAPAVGPQGKTQSGNPSNVVPLRSQAK